jgi:S1-C subfamily serine protease
MTGMQICRVRFMLVVGASLLLPNALVSQIPGPQPRNSTRSVATRELSAEEIFERFAKRVLFLTCDESADESSLASGVLVSADGLIVTNAHVVEKCLSMTAMFISGASRRSYQPTLKYYDYQSDTAVLKIAGNGFDFFTIAARPARIGERVYAIGNPRGFEQSISEGIVSGNREEDGVPWIQHSAPISPGSSGGALISSRGELLGINSRFRRESQNLNFAVSAATLARAFSAAETVPRFIDFPANANLTGTYSGVVQNLTVGESADFKILVTDNNGAIQGCMIVRPPLLGSGSLRGTAGATRFSFLVVGDSTQISFDGQRNATELKGTYVVSPSNGGPEQKGEFTLHKTSLDGLTNGFNVRNCLTDATVLAEAAEQGNPTAQYTLGSMYILGQGLPKDYRLSYFWIKLAATGKVVGVKQEEITGLLDAIAGHLTTTELSEVQERARVWLAEHTPNTQ